MPAHVVNTNEHKLCAMNNLEISNKYGSRHKLWLLAGGKKNDLSGIRLTWDAMWFMNHLWPAERLVMQRIFDTGSLTFTNFIGWTQGEF